MQINEPLILILSIIIGLISGALGYTFHDEADTIITVGLILMLYGVMLNIPFRRIIEASKNSRFITLSLAVNFILVPVFTWRLSSGFVNDPAILLGLLMYFVMPCTDWFLTFTSSAKGDVALGTILIPINLSIQIVLLPLYLLLFMGNTIRIDLILFLKTLALFFLIPLSLALISRHLGKRSFNQMVSDLQTFFLGIVVAVMFASQESMFIANIDKIIVIAAPILIYFISMYFLSIIVQRLFKLRYEETVLLNFTTSARNSPIALAIALGAFPSLPLTAAVIAIAPIIEIPILAVEARILGKRR